MTDADSVKNVLNVARFCPCYENGQFVCQGFVAGIYDGTEVSNVDELRKSLCVMCSRDINSHGSPIDCSEDNFQDRLVKARELIRLGEQLRSTESESQKLMITRKIDEQRAEMCELCGIPPLPSTEKRLEEQQQRRAKEEKIRLMGSIPREKPSIAEILLNFVEHKYEPTRELVGYEIAEKAIEICSSLRLPSPKEHEIEFPTDYEYADLWEKWHHFCVERHEDGCTLSDNFGKYALRIFLVYIEKEFINQYGKSPEICSFFIGLKSECNNPVAVTFFLREPESNEIKKRRREYIEQLPPNKRFQHNEYDVTYQWSLAKEIDPALEPSCKVRENDAKREEEQSKVRFELIINDGKPETLVTLVNLKNIFSKQLPKMPKEYIVRLVFDMQHKSMVCLKGTTVVGGITFRPYYPQRFAEIAFCAVTANEQVKGYGTRLMNHLKEAVKREYIRYFLTYADNYAIGYFKKQGFSKVINYHQKNWFGYIKDYDGGTLMECHILEKIDYLQIPRILQVQRSAIYEQIRLYSKSTHIYPGLPDFKNGSKGIAIEQIPGIVEAGWKPSDQKYYRDRDSLSSLHTELGRIAKQLKAHNSSWPFLKPVSKEEVPDYYDIITDPIDLETIGKRLESGEFYKTREIFFADLKRMLRNCKEYNAENTIFYKCAVELGKFLKERWGCDVDEERP